MHKTGEHALGKRQPCLQLQLRSTPCEKKKFPAREWFASCARVLSLPARLFPAPAGWLMSIKLRREDAYKRYIPGKPMCPTVFFTFSNTQQERKKETNKPKISMM